MFRLALPIVVALTLAACNKGDAVSNTPAEAPAAAPMAKAPTPPAAQGEHSEERCTLIDHGDGTVEARHNEMGYRFIAIMGPHKVECGEDGSMELSNQNETIYFSTVRVNSEGPVDPRGLYEQVIADLQADLADDPQMEFKGSRFETSPAGNLILIYFLHVKDPNTGEEADMVVFWTVRQRSNGDAFAEQFLVQIKEGMTPEEALPQMLVGFVPLLDLFEVAEE